MSGGGPSVLEVRGAALQRGDRELWSGLDLDVEPGEFIAVLGPSGSGKTTLLRCLAGLARLSGRLQVGDEVWQDERTFAAPHRRRVGYVFQDAALFDHLSVRGNLLYGRRRAGLGADAEFDRLVALLGLEGLLDRGPGKLSGGERQRVAIGRALLARPRLLLLDEPLASLDGPRRNEILRYLELMRDEVRVPIVYVSHSVEEVVRLASTVVLVAGGKVVATGDVEDVMGRPDLRAAAGVFEGGTVIDAKVAVQDIRYDLATLAFEDGERRELEVLESVAGRLSSGLLGVAYLRGDTLIAFEPLAV